MSRPPYKQSSQNNHLTLENFFQDRLSSLGIREIYNPQDWKKSFPRPFIKRVGRIAMTPHREGSILLFSFGAKENLTARADEFCR
jgi:hypothetical protein